MGRPVGASWPLHCAHDMPAVCYPAGLFEKPTRLDSLPSRMICTGLPCLQVFALPGLAGRWAAARLWRPAARPRDAGARALEPGCERRCGLADSAVWLCPVSAALCLRIALQVCKPTVPPAQSPGLQTAAQAAVGSLSRRCLHTSMARMPLWWSCSRRVLVSITCTCACSTVPCGLRACLLIHECANTPPCSGARAVLLGPHQPGAAGRVSRSNFAAEDS